MDKKAIFQKLKQNFNLEMLSAIVSFSSQKIMAPKIILGKFTLVQYCFYRASSNV